MNSQTQSINVFDKLFSKTAYNCLAITLGALFLALASLCRFQLWFSPVPVTMQTLAVMLMGAFLGSRKAPLAVLTYLGCSSLGVPLCIGALGGVTSGYLIGFVVAAFLVGRGFEMGWGKRVLSSVALFASAALVIHAAGLAWLGSIIGFREAFLMGFVPFVLVDVAKVCVAAGIMKAKWKLTRS